MKLGNVLRGCILFVLLNVPCLIAQQQAVSSPNTIVPRLMRFSGAISDAGGGPKQRVAGVTFFLYKDQQGGAALWMETQNVKLDSTGHYTAFLGWTKADGLPTELFASGEARWLGVHVEGQPEQPRVLLLSVPYALKAADAETLGGKPASAFSLAPTLQAGSTTTSAGATLTPQGTNASGASRGTAGYIARWTSSKTLGNAILFYQDATGRVGIGTTTPLSLLHVNGVAQVGPGTANPSAMLNAMSNVQGYPAMSAAGYSSATTSTEGINAFGGNNGTESGSGSNGIVATGGTGANGGAGLIGNGGTALGAPEGGIFLSGTGVVGVGGPPTSFKTASGDGVHGIGAGGSLPASGVVGNGGDSSYSGGAGVIGTGGESFTVGSGGPGLHGIGGPSSPPFPDGDGVLAQTADGVSGGSPGFAGNFLGDLNVTGAIFAGTKDFKIDHPLDPANKYLLHASVESSEMMDVYSGNTIIDARGESTVLLPQWFEAVNADFRYQLTAIGAPSPGLYIAKEISNHQFTIAGGTPGIKVSWQISAVRHDPYAKANPLVVEQAKNARERGYYVHPKLYGAAEEKGIEWARYPQIMRKTKELRMKKLRTKGATDSVK